MSETTNTKIEPEAENETTDAPIESQADEAQPDTRPTVSFAELSDGDLFQIPGDHQGRTFKKLPPHLGNLACDVRGIDDEITDEFSPGDRVIPLD